MKKMKKSAAILAAAAVVLTGCLLHDLPDRFEITAINILEGGSPVEDYVFLNANTTERTLTAAVIATESVTEEDGLELSWSVVSGDAHVSLSEDAGPTTTVTSKTPGVAVIRAEASFEDAHNSREFYVFVNSGSREWSFGVFDGQADISEGVVSIAPGGEKGITLREFGNGLAFSVTGNSSPAVVTASAITDNAFTLTAAESAAAGASSTVTVKAERGSESMEIAFTVRIQIRPLFEWDSATTPMSSIGANSLAPSGYDNINFAARGSGAVTSAAGALNIASGAILLVGGTQASAVNDATTTHREGQFDLSQDRFRITINYRDYSLESGSENSWIRVLINNNTGGQAQSVLGAEAVLLMFRNNLNSTVSAGGTFQSGENWISVTVTPSSRFGSAGSADYASLETAFIGIRCSESSITVTGIKLEKVPE